MRCEVVAVRANRVAGGAQIDGRESIQRAEGQRGAHLRRRIAEHGDRGDVVGDQSGHRLVEADGGEGNRGDDVDDRRALRVTAEDEPGVGQLAAMYWMWALASLAPLAAARKSNVAG